MKTAFWFVLFAPFVAAQDPGTASPPASGVVAPGATPSAAEQQFREAWWAESGRNDLDAALRGYLAAVILDGPPAVRAKSMLAAGRIQQRQGRTEHALASYRRVLSEFAGETESVNAARTHLRELTAVDLRQNYDEWYERRLFSEEVQLLILGKLESLSSHLSRQFNDNRQQQESQAQRSLLRGEILAFGKGAVPALRKAARGRHEALASTAIEMLFALGEVPPLEALVADAEWTNDVGAWKQLLRTRGAEAKVSGSGWHPPFLAAATRGPGALVDLLLQPDTRPTEALTPMLSALLGFENARPRVLAAFLDPETSLGLRDAIAQALTAYEEVVLGCGEWVQLAHDPLRGSLQAVAAEQAARSLTAENGKQLDELLQIVGTGAGDGGIEADVCVRFLSGLDENPLAERLPWNLERLQALLRVAAVHSPVVRFGLRLRRNDRTRLLLAAALLADPSGLAAVLRRNEASEPPVERLRTGFPDQDSESSPTVFRRLWQSALVTTLKTQWSRYDEPQQLDALLVLDGVTDPANDRRVLQEFLRAQRDGASAGVKAAMGPLLEPARN